MATNTFFRYFKLVWIIFYQKFFCYIWDESINWFIFLALSWQRSLSYRNQSIDLQSQSVDWFLYDRDLRHERVIPKTTKSSHDFVVTKKNTHIWRRWGHLRVSFWHLLMNFEKPKKSEFWKNEKKIAGDIIILHMCTKNHNHVRYSFWDSEWDKFFLSFWAIFGPLPTPTNNPENLNFEKMKKESGDVIILNLCNKKHNQMMYAHSDIDCNRYNFL